MSNSKSSKFAGNARRMVIAFDVGTTFSGISYCVLDPGMTPKICSVTRYPGQEHASGSSKIPSVLYYDSNGNVRAAGAEVDLPENQEKAEEEEWLKVEWFKMRMAPKSMPMALQTSTLPPLPPSKTVMEVFGDFMRYLMQCAERFIVDTHATLSRSWKDLRDNVIFVIGHPNGWEGAQQAKMRNAAVYAQLVPDTPAGRSRVKFVTEGEASLHYCLRGGFVENKSRGFIIADLGGGTLDFSAYKVTDINPLRAVEVAATKCALEGSTLVTLRAKGFVKEKLKESKFGSDDHVKQISDKFDDTTKKTFRSVTDVCLVAFGSITEKDPDHGIRSGKLKLLGEEVGSFFEPSIAATIENISAQIREANVRVATIYLVGGFAASPYVRSQLNERLANLKLTVTIPDGQTSKAVAEGAVSFYLDNFVTSRIAKYSYGTRYSYFYEPDSREHIKRKKNVWIRPSGQKMISGGFKTVLSKGTAMDSAKDFRQHYGSEISNLSDLTTQTLEIFSYAGSNKPPDWEDQIQDRNLLKSLCIVSADLTTMRSSLQAQTTPTGTQFWAYSYDIVISFGGTELVAQIAWKENGVERWSPAQVLYEDEGVIEEVVAQPTVQEEPENLKPDLTPAIDRFFKRFRI